MALTPKTVSSKRNFAGHQSEETPVTTTFMPSAQTVRGDGFFDPQFTPGADKAVQVAVASYDFTKDGALASGAIFGTGVFVPKNAVVTRAGLYTDVLVAGPSHNQVTLYGAGVGATASADANLVASTAVSSVIGTSVIGVPVGATASTWIHTGAHPREILIDFTPNTPAATTAGRVMVWVEYFIVAQGTPTAHGDSI